MPYVTPTVVASGDVATAAAWNVLTNDVINLRALANVVGTTKTDTFSESVVAGGSSALVTGLTATITPTSATSKVLVHGFISVGLSVNNDQRVFVRLERNQPSASTLVAVGDAAGNRRRMTGTGAIVALEDMPCVAFAVLDSPASTSAIIYSITLGHSSGITRTVYVNQSGADANATTSARGASSIIVQEIPA